MSISNDAIYRNADTNLGSDSQSFQVMCQLIRTAVEFAICQAFFVPRPKRFTDHGNRIGCAVGLGIKQLMDTTIVGIPSASVIPLHQELVMLGIGENGQLGNRLIGMCNNALKQCFKMPRHTHDRVFDEQIGIVVDYYASENWEYQSL